jgi:hypothetical protein
MTEEYGHIPDAFYLSQEEIETLRKSKKELTEYGKEKLRKLIYEQDMKKMEDGAKNLVLQNLTHEEMLSIAEEREKLQAGFKQDADGNWYRPTLEELTRNERIDLAITEMRYILWGGQDGREFGNSVGFIVNVLKSLKDKEDVEFNDSADGVA